MNFGIAALARGGAANGSEGYRDFIDYAVEPSAMSEVVMARAGFGRMRGISGDR